MEQFNKPILYLIFNRPDMVKITFEPVRNIQPRLLYIAADGPRDNHKEDKNLCEETRKLVLDSIDWDCEVKTLFREKNLGCGVAISSAIDWFFSEVEDGIIIEDDCLASYSFFAYAETLLNKYKNNEQVFIVSGNNRLPIENKEADYFFSAIPAAWGWATWRRVWIKYDFRMSKLAEYKDLRKINKVFKEKSSQKYWIEFFEEMSAKKINNWDLQLVFMCFFYNGLTVVPNKNLVTNIGTKISNGPKTFLPKQEIRLSRHPSNIERYHEYDQKVMQQLINPYYIFKTWLKRSKLFYLFKKPRRID